MRFTGQFTIGNININKYKYVLEKYLQKEMERVASAWLEAVVGKVPVWSGMSRGSLLSLVELISGTLLVTPRAGVPSRVSEGKSLGEATPNYNLDDFKITIVTNVPHYNVQEYYNVNISKSAPWLSRQAGKAAAEIAVKEVILPKPRIYKKTLKVR